jgi:hypothetical protein
LSEAYSVAAERLPVMRSPRLRLLKTCLLKTRPVVVSRWCCQSWAHCFPVAVSHSPQPDCFVQPKTERSCLPRSMVDAELRERCWLESLSGCSPPLPEALCTLLLAGLPLARRGL